MKGQAFLALIILIGIIVILIGITLAFSATGFVDTGYGYQASLQAEVVAASGVQDALLQLDRYGTAWSPSPNPYTLSVGSSTATVTITQNSTSTNVLSTATVSNRTRNINVVVAINASTSQATILAWQEQ